MFDELLKLSRHFLEIKYSSYRRYFIRQNSFPSRLSLLMGARGVGKTTTLIQALLNYTNGDRFDPRILYVQTDHFSMGRTSLFEIAEQFVAYGGEWVVFDEIHKYPDWSKELKSIYDTFNLKILASGSSALQIHKGSHDLSRRAIVYQMQGMSFREYLELTYQLTLPIFKIEEICQSHEMQSAFIFKELENVHLNVLREFHRYLKIGYYPYFFELKEEALYQITLEQNVHTTIESDLVAIYPQLTGISIYKIKQLLRYIAGAVPFNPDLNQIKNVLEIGDIRTLKNYLTLLQEAGLILALPKATKKFNQLESPAKIYLNNPNQLFSIAPEVPQKGTVRETFFFNMVSQGHEVSLPSQGDFQIQDTIFEVGGKNKTAAQIKSLPNAFVACDDIHQGVGSKIPLWLFGFLY